MSGNPIVSVVIRNRNGREVICKCIESVLRSTLKNIEIIVVDDASTDNSPELVEKKYSRYGVEVIRLKRNVGPAVASNIGAYVAKGKYIAFLDNDTEVTPNWLKYPLKLMETKRDIVVVQSLLLKTNEKKIDSAGHYLHILSQPIEVIFLGKTPRSIYEIFGAKQAAMIVRRDALIKAGGFDKDFFFYFEETDLCWRLRLMGYKVVLCPYSIVYHKGGHIMGKKKAKVLFYRERNTLLAMMKNYSLTNLLKYLPLRLILDSLSTIALIILNKPHYAFALIKAIMQVFSPKILRKTMKKRAYVERYLRKLSDREAMKNLTISNIALLLRYLMWRVNVEGY